MPSFTSNNAEIHYQTFGDPKIPRSFFQTRWAQTSTCGNHKLLFSRKIIL
mgnify:CR=1 FL=1